MKEFSKVRVGAVSYLNTRPLVYGFEQGLMKESVELVSAYPAKIADMLLNDEIDINFTKLLIVKEVVINKYSFQLVKLTFSMIFSLLKS